MLKRFGLPVAALLGMFVLFSATPANAQVRFGVAVGGPAPVYGYAAPPVYPAYPYPAYPNADPYYSAPAYPYYAPPVYVGPSYGYGYGYGYRSGYYRPAYRGNYGRGYGNYRGGGGYRR